MNDDFAGETVRTGADSWSAEDPLAPEPHPERIGPYRIVRELGAGGMGVVYEARQEQPVERTVALKLIRPGFDTRQVIARFESERQALARMSHPAIAQVYDAGSTPEGSLQASSMAVTPSDCR